MRILLAAPIVCCIASLLQPIAHGAVITQWAAGESDFVSNGIQNSPYYHPVFTDPDGGASLSFGPGGSGGWQFTITAPGAVTSIPVNGGLGNGGIGISPVSANTTLTINFSGNLPTAIGGNFFRTDANFPAGLVSGVIRATATDGATTSIFDVTSTTPSTFGFGGFTTDGVGFSSLTLSFPSASPGNWATVGNFYVGLNAVPEPGTWIAGGFIGLFIVGRTGWGILRRRLARQ